MTLQPSVVVHGPVRTTIGALGGSLKDAPTPDLGPVAIHAAVDRSRLKPEEVQTAAMGKAGAKMNPSPQAAVHRRLEADLAHTNRGSMIGELAASLAHEIKQPIAATVMDASACMRWLSRDPPDVMEASGAASRAIAAATRAAEMIDRIRSLYGGGVPEREAVDLNEIILEMSVLLRETADRRSVSIRTELEPGLPRTIANRVQLQEVLMNLMLNAIEAMRETGGELTLASQRTEQGQPLISVSDSGVGLPVDAAARIFDPFFTTNPHGTGMGLSVSRRIIESHGGRLWVSPNEERGAIFQFTLPSE